MLSKIRLSILIATHNRSEILQQTLKNFMELDFGHLEPEFVIIDNNSTDTTRDVVQSFFEHLPLKYLFVPKPGKNCALNGALRQIQLNEIVVFTDDDVKPKKNWLLKIIEISERWPHVSVFGGKIYPIWPDSAPELVVQFPEDLLQMCYAVHDCGEMEVFYGKNTKLSTPFGPNFWVRKSIFDQGYLFDESIGPTPNIKTRIMGSETSLLKSLIKDGYKIIYSPCAEVGHYITEHQMTSDYIRKRVATRARAIVRQSSHFKQKSLYQKTVLLWLLLRLISLFKHFILKQFTYLRYKNKEIAFQYSLGPELWIHYNLYYLKEHKMLIECL